MERSFNLIDEAWISVITEDCKIKDISLQEALLNAHNYSGLSGETKAQDFAILRLLLALMYTIFYRYNLDSEKIDPAEDENVIMDNWEGMWKNGYIPAAPVEKYFSEWHDRFWLFDDEQPFYQTKKAQEKGTHFSTAKMIGTLFESDNKIRLFSDRKEQSQTLSYPEAARWLLHLNYFDDRAAKYERQVPTPTWVSRLGMVALKGKNLFKTIMLNFCAEYDYKRNVFEQHPSWEDDNSNPKFKRIILVPNNQAALLSLMSRRIFLCREDDTVNGYYLYGGDYFEDTEVFHEQMTLWKAYQEEKDKKAKNDIYHFRPKLHDPTKKIWREFGSIAGMEEENNDKSKRHGRSPGIIKWLKKLLNEDILDRSYMASFEVAAVIYNENQQSSLPVIDVISDSLTFHVKLLEDVGEVWRKRINLEINKCDNAAKQIFILYKNIQISNGYRDNASKNKNKNEEENETDENKNEKKSQSGETEAKMQFYSQIDRHFRLWLEGLKVEQDIDSYTTSLERELKGIALNLGSSFIAQVGSQTIFGRVKKADKSDKNDKAIEIKSSAEAYSFFVYNINKIFDKAGEKNEQS